MTALLTRGKSKQNSSGDNTKPSGKKDTAGVVDAAPRPGETIVLGGPPRVHLLPREVLAHKHAKVLRRRLGLGFVGVVILVALGIVGSSVAMLAAQGSLLGAQQTLATLHAQQLRYRDVTVVQADVAAIKSSQKLATTKEILWDPYVAQISTTLQPGMSLTGVNAVIAPDAVAAPSATSIPLEKPRIATISVTVSSPQDSIPAWLQSLQNLDGFVDVTPKSATLDDTTGLVAVIVDIHVDKGALANRFNTTAK